MKKFGIIGKKLTHSFSPKYFTDYFEKNNIRNHIYTPYEIQSIEEIKLIWQYNPELCGMNVTIPYKIEIIDFLSSVFKTQSISSFVWMVLLAKQTSHTQDEIDWVLSDDRRRNILKSLNPKLFDTFQKSTTS